MTRGEAEEASLAVSPSVLILGVNRNIKSRLGGQETGNNQNTVSCPRPGRWAACHPPSPAWGFPGLASTQVAAATLCLVGPGARSGPHPRGLLVRHPESCSHPEPTHGHHPAGDIAASSGPHQPSDPRRGGGHGEGLRGGGVGGGPCTCGPSSAARAGASPPCLPTTQSQLGGPGARGEGGRRPPSLRGPEPHVMGPSPSAHC